MSKTPYELRFNLLKMAQDILNEQNMNERIRIENNWNMDCERARMTAERSDTTPIFPNFPAVPHYDEAEVIAMASRLNEFVSKND